MYMGISTRGDYHALYPLLVNRLREKIADAHRNTMESARLINRYYPPALRDQALHDLGPRGVRTATTPEGYLAGLIEVSGRPALSVGERLASRIKGIRKVVPGTYELVTVSGARLRFVKKGDGRFYLVPTGRDVRLIRQEYLLSIERLNATRNTVKDLGFDE